MPAPATPATCRDCDARPGEGAIICPACGSRRILRHAELFALAIAHVDCDAFYASVEKRENPDLLARPVIVGGGRRGVVSAACYVARLSGVRSAMPMFKALKLCPDAVVIRPNMSKYAAVARQVRRAMEALTPLVLPLSIDEAVMDLSGTEALHGAPPAVMLARFARGIERDLGITVSVGLASNRLLAKIAADRDKPRGFAVIGRAEAAGLLSGEPVTLLPGIGPAAARALERAGLTRLGQLGALSPAEALRRLGSHGPALARMARGEDDRPVDPERETKSISAETTFASDLAARAALERALWPLCEKLALRLKEKELAAAGVVLKLKTADFALRTRAARLSAPTRVADTLFAAVRPLLAREADGGTAFRLIGIGAQPLAPIAEADRGDLADPDAPRRARMQDAMDRLRSRFGKAVIGKGRAWRPGDAGRPAGAPQPARADEEEEEEED
ncbi:MAG: DNA polymerase IV [Alphaproteobacteria bacterium]|nr:DNA polymerase IV [Alphaproteobacteria bacterium]